MVNALLNIGLITAAILSFVAPTFALAAFFSIDDILEATKVTVWIWGITLTILMFIWVAKTGGWI